MKIKLIGDRTLFSSALEQFAAELMESKLTPTSVDTVQITVIDHNGPKKGLDRECVARTRVGRKNIVVRERGRDLYLVIQQTARKLRSMVLKLHHRERRVRRTRAFAGG